MPSDDFATAAPAAPAAADAAGPARPGLGERPAYRKLPGRMASLRVGNYGLRRLYLGDDHLLQVETVFCVENYRRFAYADIQALLLRQTPRGLILSVILGVLAAGFGLLAWASNGPESGGIVCLVLAGVWVLLLVVNLVRGPTCRCQLQTAIGQHPLLSLSRLRPARKALALLEARIEAAQGALAPGTAATLVDERLTGRRR